MNRMLTQLRRLAYAESVVLREYVKAGRRVPQVQPLAKPWHDQFISTDARLDGNQQPAGKEQT